MLHQLRVEKSAQNLEAILMRIFTASDQLCKVVDQLIIEPHTRLETMNRASLERNTFVFLDHLTGVTSLERKVSHQFAITVPRVSQILSQGGAVVVVGMLRQQPALQIEWGEA